MPRPSTVLPQHHSSYRFHKALPKLQQTNAIIKANDNQTSFNSGHKNQQSNELHCLYRSLPKSGMNVTRGSFMLRGKESPGSRKYQAVTKQGKRSYNQDRYLCKTKIQSPFLITRKQARNQYDLYAVFDGHGGSQCSEFLKENFHLIVTRSTLLETNPEEALKEAFAKIE